MTKIVSYIFYNCLFSYNRAQDQTMVGETKRERKATEILNMGDEKKTKTKSKTAPAPVSGSQKTRKSDSAPAPTTQSPAVPSASSDPNTQIMATMLTTLSALSARLDQLEQSRLDTQQSQDATPSKTSAPTPTKLSPGQPVVQDTTPSKTSAPPSTKSSSGQPVVQYVQQHLADVTPLSDYIHLQLEPVRVVTRSEPSVKGMKNGAPSRQMVSFYLTARPRLDAKGRLMNEPSSVQLTIWSAMGAPVPLEPAVGTVVTVRGFTGCTSTGTFDKWHIVELTSQWDSVRFETVQDDGAIPWEKLLNPRRTIQSRTASTNTSNVYQMVQTPVAQHPAIQMPAQQFGQHQLPLHLPPLQGLGFLNSGSPVLQLSAEQRPQQQLRFCSQCGGALTGPNRRATCDNGAPH